MAFTEVEIRKKLLILTLCAMTMLCAGCGTTYQEVADVNVTGESYANGYFTGISKWSDAGKI